MITFALMEPFLFKLWYSSYQFISLHWTMEALRKILCFTTWIDQAMKCYGFLCICSVLKEMYIKPIVICYVYLQCTEGNAHDLGFQQLNIAITPGCANIIYQWIVYYLWFIQFGVIIILVFRIKRPLVIRSEIEIRDIKWFFLHASWSIFVQNCFAP